MATATLTITTNKTGAQLAALLTAAHYAGGKVFVQIKSKGGNGGTGAGPTNGGGGPGYAEWGTSAGFASDGVDLGTATDDLVDFATLLTNATGLALAGGTLQVTNGLSDGTAGDDGSGSDVGPMVGNTGEAGSAAGAGGGGGGGGAATAASKGNVGSAGGAVNGGAGGLDGDGAAGGGDGGNTGVAGHNATNGGGGGSGAGSSTPGTGTAAYVKLTFNIITSVFLGSSAVFAASTASISAAKVMSASAFVETVS